jgi:hypothetical protein
MHIPTLKAQGVIADLDNLWPLQFWVLPLERNAIVTSTADCRAYIALFILSVVVPFLGSAVAAERWIILPLQALDHHGDPLTF